MRRILKYFLVCASSLYIVSETTVGLEFAKGAETFLLASAALTVASILAKPVINLLLLPINLITFGLFRWLSYGVILYLVTLVVDGFKVNGFQFAGFTSTWFDIPPVNFEGLLAYIAYALYLALLTSVFHWILK